MAETILTWTFTITAVVMVAYFLIWLTIVFFSWLNDADKFKHSDDHGLDK